MPDIIAPSVPTGLTATLTTGYTLTGFAAAFTTSGAQILVAAAGSYAATGSTAADRFTFTALQAGA